MIKISSANNNLKEAVKFNMYACSIYNINENIKTKSTKSYYDFNYGVCLLKESTVRTIHVRFLCI